MIWLPASSPNALVAYGTVMLWALPELGVNVTVLPLVPKVYVVLVFENVTVVSSALVSVKVLPLTDALLRYTVGIAVLFQALAPSVIVFYAVPSAFRTIL